MGSIGGLVEAGNGCVFIIGLVLGYGSKVMDVGIGDYGIEDYEAGRGRGVGF